MEEAQRAIQVQGEQGTNTLVGVTLYRCTRNKHAGRGGAGGIYCSNISQTLQRYENKHPPPPSPSTHTHQHLPLLLLTLVQQMQPFISSGYRYCLPVPPAPPHPPSPKHTHSPTSVSPATDPCAADAAEQPCVPPRTVWPTQDLMPAPPRLWGGTLLGLCGTCLDPACMSVSTNIPWGYMEEVGGRVEPSEVYVVHAWTQKQNHNENTRKRRCWNLPRSMWYMPGPQNKITMRTPGRGDIETFQGLCGTCLDPKTKPQWEHQEEAMLKPKVYVVHAWTQKQNHNENTWKRLGWIGCNPPRSKRYMPGPRNKTTMRTPGRGGDGCR